MTTTDVVTPTHHSTNQKPKLLFFHSVLSGPSRRAEGYLAQVLQRGHNHDTFQLHRIAHEESPELAQRLRVATFPTFLIVEGTAIRGRLEQPRNAKTIEQFLLPWLNASEARRQSRSTPT